MVASGAVGRRSVPCAVAHFEPGAAGGHHPNRKCRCVDSISWSRDPSSLRAYKQVLGYTRGSLRPGEQRVASHRRRRGTLVGRGQGSSLRRLVRTRGNAPRQIPASNPRHSPDTPASRARQTGQRQLVHRCPPQNDAMKLYLSCLYASMPVVCKYAREV